MTNTNITNFRRNAFEYFEKAVTYNDTVHVSTKNGNAVVMSEEDYNALMETIYLLSHPKTAREIVEGLHTPLSDCISEGELDI